MKFMQRSLMGLFLLSLTVGLLALAAGSIRNALQERWAKATTSRPARERVFSVNVITAKSLTANPKIKTYGEVLSRRTLDLRAPVAGTIVELSPNFVDGGRVAKAELLMRLDPADAQSALDLSKSELNEAKAEQNQAATALVLAGDELRAARSQTALRKMALDRQNNLIARGVGTEAAAETAALAQASADQIVLGKRQAQATAKARLSRAKTALARREIRLAEAERRLANTKIYAEFQGVLSNVTAVTGGLVSPNEKIARLIDPTALEVSFRLSNSAFSRLIAANGGQAKGLVTVRLDAFGADIVVKGRIERVGAEVGQGQTGRLIFARLPSNDAQGLRPGDFVTVEVAEPPMTNVAILPAVAVDAAGKVLALGKNDRLEELQVQVLRKQGDTVILRGDGLLGREIVQTRSPFLGAGIRVKPVRASSSSLSKTSLQGVELIELTPERRARLVAFVERNNNIPDDRKQVLIARLKEAKVPANIVKRIEKRMGS
ncbi:MAG: HlyD family efflux transporter periplasmic adaptor subunit [Alphaproteobacteria bacterium]|nr:HlyD family efflux transporter periplasmic adaptor subunit [Alphaproteobacteria bacterium]